MNDVDMDAILDSRNESELTDFYPLQQQNTTITKDDLTSIFQMLKKSTNIDFSQFKLTTILRQIQRLMKIHDIRTFVEFEQTLAASHIRVEELSKALLVNVSSFFRNNDAFDFLKKHVVPRILESVEDNKEIRIWSVGCSTGEEALTAVIIFLEVMENLGLNRSLQVFATDIDDEALQLAKIGFYPSTIEQEICPILLSKYFIREDSGYRVMESIRRNILFTRHNIMKDPSFSKLDLVLCRNVLIYFTPGMQRQVVSHLTFALKKGGYLFTGMSESIYGFSAYYELMSERSKIYKKIKHSPIEYNLALKNSRNPFKESLKHMEQIDMLCNDELVFHEHEQLLSQVIKNSVNQQLLSVWMPPTILIDSHERIIYIYGDISSFMQQSVSGRMLNYYKKFLRKPLAIIVEKALNRAATYHDVVFYQDVELVETNWQDFTIFTDHELAPNIASEKIDIRVESISSSDFDEVLTAVTFMNYRVNTDIKLDQFHPIQQEKILEYEDAQRRIVGLEKELSRYHRQSKLKVESLEVTNEELQTSNEELISANEELQIMNEELGRLNSQCAHKINELEGACRSTLGLIQSTGIAFLFLDDQLNVQSFTDEMRLYFGLESQDIGRPIRQFSHIFDMSNLISCLANVIHEGQKQMYRVKLKDDIELDEFALLNGALTNEVRLELRPCANNEISLGGVVLSVGLIYV